MRNIALSFLVLTGGALAHATPTILVSMPVADILRHRELSLGYTIAGSPNGSRDVLHVPGFEIGLFDRVEFGFDSDLRGGNTLDAKVLLWESEMAALSVGILGWQDNVSSRYIVGRYDYKGMRFHGSLMRTPDANVAQFGIDFAFGPGTVMADYTSGRGGYTWLGYAFSPMDHVSVTLAGGRPTDASGGYQYYATVTYGMRF